QATDRGWWCPRGHLRDDVVRQRGTEPAAGITERVIGGPDKIESGGFLTEAVPKSIVPAEPPKQLIQIDQIANGPCDFAVVKQMGGRVKHHVSGAQHAHAMSHGYRLPDQALG